jgi:prevent-host-death family protein
MAWQLQQAKQQFSEVVRRALEDGPQVVTRHGRQVVVVVSAAEFETSRPDSAKDFKQFLRSAPDLGRLRLARDRRRTRRVAL